MQKFNTEFNMSSSIYSLKEANLQQHTNPILSDNLGQQINPDQLEGINPMVSPHDLPGQKRPTCSHQLEVANQLANIHQLTGRNVILYYSGWLEKPEQTRGKRGDFFLNENDVQSLKANISPMNPANGLDLILHTPGGSITATKAIVEHLHTVFGTDIRAIIRGRALSAGTMIVCACRTLFMSADASLGAFDPQLERRSLKEVAERLRSFGEVTGLSRSGLWDSVIADCEKISTRVEEMVGEWLCAGMFQDAPDNQAIANQIVAQLTDHTQPHKRHISFEQARQMNLAVFPLEAESELFKMVDRLFYSAYQTVRDSQSVQKIIANHLGTVTFD